jgi:hypothetical protein
MGDALRLRIDRLVPLIEEGRQDDGGKDSEDHHDREQLDQGEPGLLCMSLSDAGAHPV